jgi:hypothetical protein
MDIRITNNFPFTREKLHQRHRLSHQQIDDWLGEQESAKYMNEKMRLVGNLREFIRVTDLWRQHGIAFIPIKGPMLSYRIYDDPSCRMSRDFDFLLRPEDIRKTIELLKSAGYRDEGYIWPQNSKNERFLMQKYDQYSMFHPEQGVAIEIHWKLFKHAIIEKEPAERIVAENTQEIAFTGRSFIVFAPEFELLFLIIHGGLHAWARLKWLVDIHELVTRFELNEEKFSELVQQLKAHRLVVLCNAMLQTFYRGTKLLPGDYAVPRWFYRFALSQTLRKSDVPFSSPLNFLRYTWFRMQVFPGWKYKLSAFRLLTFSPQDMKVSWLPPRSIAFALYRPVGYLVRIFRKMFKNDLPGAFNG